MAYMAVLFADLERHSLAWSRIPRERMVATIGEYRYLAESLASQYGARYSEWAGDGHMFLFEGADTAVQFAVTLLAEWVKRRQAGADIPDLPLRLGCHFGECTPMPGGTGWIGRANAVAKRTESEAGPDSLMVTDGVLDLIDLPLYVTEPAGEFALKGDHLDLRRLHRILSFDRAALLARPPDELTAEDWFRKGLALVGTPAENTDEEARCYREALRLRPDYAEAHANLAIVLASQGRSGEAAADYQEALRLRPEDAETHANYAALLTAMGSLSGATEHYREALRLKPEHVDAHIGYAAFLASRGELADAAAHYEEAIRLRPEAAETRTNYAIVLEDLGRFADAEREHMEALRLQPGDAPGHYNHALLLERMGATEGAEREYRAAIRLWSDYAEAHNNLAVLLHLRGDLAAAEEHYREAVRLRPQDPETHYNYGLLLRAKGDEGGAAMQLRTASDLAPDVARSRTALDAPARAPYARNDPAASTSPDEGWER